MSAVYRFLRITPEAVAGTFDGTATGIYIPMDTSNQFKPMTKASYLTIMDASGLNVPRLRRLTALAFGAQLRTRLYMSQAATLLGWAMQRVDSGQTAPWTTDQLPNDLASATVEFAYSYANNATLRRKRYLGTKVLDWSLEASNSPDDPCLYLTLTLAALVGQSNPVDSSSDPNATAFPAPALTDFPTNVVCLQDLALSIGTSRTKFDRVQVRGQNKARAYFDGGKLANRIRCNGRTVTWGAHLRLDSTPDDRAHYEAVTTLGTGSLVGTVGANTFTLNMHGQDLSQDDDPYYQLGMTTLLDTSAGVDLTLTTT
jgi:hypothetical protein